MPTITPPTVSITEPDLSREGFTSSGKTKFKTTIQDFANQVFQKSIGYAEAERAQNFSREVTHDHITAASAGITRTFGRKSKSNWRVMAHIGEYVCAICAGVGGGNIASNWGILLLAGSTAVGVLLIVVRIKD